MMRQSLRRPRKSEVRAEESLESRPPTAARRRNLRYRNRRSDRMADSMSVRANSSHLARDLRRTKCRHRMKQVEGCFDDIHRQGGAGSLAEAQVELEQRARAESLQHLGMSALGGLM